MNIEKNKNMIRETIENLGYELVSLEKKTTKDGKTLEIVVDRATPIQMNDIVELTNHINKVLDEIDDEEENYLLDISSLGAEKPLKINELEKYIGSYVNAHVINPIKGENIIEGTLSEVKDKKAIIKVKVKTRVIDYETTLDNIDKIRLAIKF